MIEKIRLEIRRSVIMGKMYQGSLVCKGKLKTQNRDLHSL